MTELSACLTSTLFSLSATTQNTKRVPHQQVQCCLDDPA